MDLKSLSTENDSWNQKKTDKVQRGINAAWSKGLISEES